MQQNLRQHWRLVILQYTFFRKKQVSHSSLHTLLLLSYWLLLLVFLQIFPVLLHPHNTPKKPFKLRSWPESVSMWAMYNLVVNSKANLLIMTFIQGLFPGNLDSKRFHWWSSWKSLCITRRMNSYLDCNRACWSPFHH